MIMIFVLGLCFGSFVNMLVYRTAVDYGLIKLGRDKSRPYQKNSRGLIHQTRSYCDYCGRQLRWYENIPIVSWLIQKGKTRCCNKKLPILYPIVEIVMGILFLIFNFQNPIFNEFINFQLLIQFLIGLIIIIFLVFSLVFDLKYMILPDFSTAILVSSVLVLWCFRYFGEWSYWWSGLVSFGFLGFLYLITNKKGMGFGDVKLAIFMGLFLGYPKVVIAFYIAFISGALVALILMIFKKANKKTLIPFGPFLILGILITWFWGQELLSLSVFQFVR